LIILGDNDLKILISNIISRIYNITNN